MLQLNQVSAAYGKSQVLWDVSLDIGAGQAVALLGRNGVGKTTLLRTIVGLQGLSGGSIRFGEDDTFGKSPAFARARQGLAYVPQGRGIFPHLSVKENLLMGLPALSKRLASERDIPTYIYDLFPILSEMAERKGGNLSGGQQQQLAIGRALVTRPKLLLLDEPTEGIQPSIVRQIEGALGHIRSELGVAVLLVEQYLEFAWSFADRFFVMQKGRVVDSGSTAERSASSVESYMGV